MSDIGKKSSAREAAKGAGFSSSGMQYSNAPLTAKEEKAREVFIAWRKDVLQELVNNGSVPEGSVLNYEDEVVLEFTPEEWREFVEEGGNVRAYDVKFLRSEIDQEIRKLQKKVADIESPEDREAAQNDLIMDITTYRQISVKHWEEREAVAALFSKLMGTEAKGMKVGLPQGSDGVDNLLKTQFLKSEVGAVNPVLKINLLNRYRRTPDQLEATLAWVEEKGYLTDVEINAIQDFTRPSRDVVAGFISVESTLKPFNPQRD